jgi:hypothetical protein
MDREWVVSVGDVGHVPWTYPRIPIPKYGEAQHSGVAQVS